MCGRYYVDLYTIREAGKLAGQVDSSYQRPTLGDIYPSQAAPVITGKAPGLYLESMEWGFPRPDHPGLLINARAETVLERKMFSEGVRRRRCIIPAKCFYEWDAYKNKVTFLRNTMPMLKKYQEYEQQTLIW